MNVIQLKLRYVYVYECIMWPHFIIEIGVENWYETRMSSLKIRKKVHDEIQSFYKNHKNYFNGSQGNNIDFLCFIF